MDERRVHPRVPVDRRVGIVQSNGEIAYGRATDLSLGGISVACKYMADNGQEFDLIMTLPDGGRSGRFEARARVVWVNYAGGERNYRIGMQFLGFKGNSQELLSAFVGERLR